VLGLWAAAVASRAADDKSPVKQDVLKLAEGKGGVTAADIAKRAEQLEEVMDVFKPRDKGGAGLGPTPGAIRPDGIELKLIDLGKKREMSKADVDKQADALARAGEITRAVADITVYFTEKDGKKNSAKWKQYTEDMKKGAEQFTAAAKQKDAKGIKAGANALNASCNNCHADFRD
jgi:hypothetical protein